MNKDLPKVYASPINKVLNNNKEVFVSSDKENRSIKSENIPQKINEIFASIHHVYKSKVRITTNNDDFITTIVGKTGNDLLTLNGEKININDIVDIERM